MKIKIINYGGKQPWRAHYNDAGADVYSAVSANIGPNKSMAIPLGFGIELPDGFMGTINPRSSYAKQGIITNLAPIDSGYRGEIHALVTNTNDYSVQILEGDRIGQLVITPIVIAEFVSETGTERGSNGFGSSGKQ